MALIRKNDRGFYCLHFNGHKFGIRKDRKDYTIWRCNARRVKNRGKCNATVRTKLIDGHEMVKVDNAKHICLKGIGEGSTSD